MKDRRYYLLIVVLILAFSAVLRWATIGDRAMSYDEVLSIFDVKGMVFVNVPDRPLDSYGQEHELIFAQAPIDWSGVYRMVRRAEGHPPLFFFLLAPWVHHFGAEPAPARALALVFGVMSVLMTIVAASYLGGRRVGLLAGALTSILPLHIFYSQDARPYSILVFATALSTYLFARTIDEPGWKWRTLLTASYVFGIYSHYYFAFLMIAQIAFIFTCSDRVKLAKLMAPVVLITALAFLPWIPALREQIGYCVPDHSQSGSIKALVYRAGWVSCNMWYGERCNFPAAIRLLCLLPVIGLLAGAWVIGWRKGWKVRLIAWSAVMPAIIPAALLFLQSEKWGTVRYYTVLIPGMATALVWAGFHMRRQVSIALWSVVLPATVAGTICYYTHPTKFELDKAVRFIKASALDQSLVISNASPSLPSYYVTGLPSRAYVPAGDASRDLPRLTRGYTSVCTFFLGDPGSPDMVPIQRWLDANMLKTKEASYLCAGAVVYRAREPIGNAGADTTPRSAE